MSEARVAELADAPDLGSGGAILVGSSPSRRRLPRDRRHKEETAHCERGCSSVRRWKATFEARAAVDLITTAMIAAARDKRLLSGSLRAR